MNKKRCNVVMALLLTPCVCASENMITEKRYKTDDINELRRIVTEEQKKASYNCTEMIFVFDCDEVLIHRIGHECGSNNFKQWRELFVKEIAKKTTNKELLGTYKSIIYKNHIKMKVDSKMPDFVNEIQRAGIKCVVLTSKNK